MKKLLMIFLLFLAGCGEFVSTATFPNFITRDIVGGAAATEYTRIEVDVTKNSYDSLAVTAADYRTTVNNGGAGSIAFGFSADLAEDCSALTYIAPVSILARAVDSASISLGGAVIAQIDSLSSGAHLMCLEVTQADVNAPVDFTIKFNITTRVVARG